MLISQRQAVAVLRAGAHRPTQRLATGLLLAGFAGPATVAGGMSLYDEAQVRARASAPTVDESTLQEACRRGVLVLRMAAQPGLALAEESVRLAAAQLPRSFSPFMRIRLVVPREKWGVVPVVATIAGHVLVTAEFVDCRAAGGGRRSASAPLLTEAGDWQRAFTQRVLPTPPGNSWIHWMPAGVRSRGPAVA